MDERFIPWKPSRENAEPEILIIESWAPDGDAEPEGRKGRYDAARESLIFYPQPGDIIRYGEPGIWNYAFVHCNGLWPLGRTEAYIAFLGGEV